MFVIINRLNFKVITFCSGKGVINRKRMEEEKVFRDVSVKMCSF